jgi:hypothetical protein
MSLREARDFPFESYATGHCVQAVTPMCWGYSHSIREDPK